MLDDDLLKLMKDFPSDMYKLMKELKNLPGEESQEYYRKIQASRKRFFDLKKKYFDDTNEKNIKELLFEIHRGCLWAKYVRENIVDIPEGEVDEE